MNKYNENDDIEILLNEYIKICKKYDWIDISNSNIESDNIDIIKKLKKYVGDNDLQYIYENYYIQTGGSLLSSVFGMFFKASKKTKKKKINKHSGKNKHSGNHKSIKKRLKNMVGEYSDGIAEKLNFTHITKNMCETMIKKCNKYSNNNKGHSSKGHNSKGHSSKGHGTGEIKKFKKSQTKNRDEAIKYLSNSDSPNNNHSNNHSNNRSNNHSDNDNDSNNHSNNDSNNHSDNDNNSNSPNNNHSNNHSDNDSNGSNNNDNNNHSTNESNTEA